ncbi:MBOAT family O-acyltransferase [Methylocapsa sp. D3K7]|uniref:MBOAT family O-acyltransferase n=1 Tax=Methylocapsa sp. D3K7 TaxID=3041435 RepID=UPI00244ED34B|nr:MBOAT family O-acyltransferase [Methylocapsa sp. D3K7]WGJ14859.1 MBOAT family O-acyltransferase [Methylocapsa sp. D3K7]
MSFVSPAFFAFLAVTVFAFHLNASVAYRRLVMGVANAVFIASYVNNVSELLPLLAFLLLGYAGLEAVRRRQTSSSLAASIVVVLAVYIFLKRFTFIEPLARLPFPYLIVGLSYILFRVLQVVVDARSGSLPGRIGPFAFFRYTCNFLCFVSGPIQRYQDFVTMDGVDAVRLDADRVYEAFSRIVKGYFKFVVIAATANYFFMSLSPQLLGAAPLGLFKLSLLYGFCVAAYTAYLYFNFSGYMDIVIGIGLLLGQVLPENFNQPFTARSFLEFWQRWHMTLSEWFKLYLFNPFLMFLMTRFSAPGLTAYLGVAAFFVTFLVMGVWHGTTLVFVIYGLLMGAGASLNKLWQIACVDRLGKKHYRTLSQTMAYVYFARGLTFAYFAVALTCLWVPELPQYLTLSRRLGGFGVGIAFVLLTLGFAATTLILDSVAAWFSTRGGGLRAVSESLVYKNMSLAIQILAMLAIASLFNAPPDFVYKAF